MTLKFSVDKKERFHIVKLNEEKLNSICAPELKTELVVLNSDGVSNIILDMESVKFVDSSGLSAILIGNRLCASSDGSFVISNVQDNVLKLIKISQLDSILNVTATVSEASDLIIMEEMEREVKEGEKK